MNGVATVAANNVWAVCAHQQDANGPSLTEYWNGTAWSVVPSPNVRGAIASILLGVAKVSANDIWTVGGYTTNNNKSLSATLTERWNGTSWLVASSPNVGTSDNTLAAVAAASESSVWTVGDYFDINSRNYLTLTEFSC